MEDEQQNMTEDPFSKLRGANSSLDYSAIIPRNYKDCAAAQRIESLLTTFQSEIDGDDKNLSWQDIKKTSPIVVVLWVCALSVGGWFFWPSTILVTILYIVAIGYMLFLTWIGSQARQLEKIIDRSLPSLFQFSDIARHFAVKGDRANYDRFVARYGELLSVGSNDPESRAGLEKLTVVRDWASLAADMDQMAVSEVDVKDEFDAENIRNNFGSSTI